MSEIVISDLTTNDVDGTGALDSIMKTVTAHLEDEYVKGRLKGPDYAKVELGALQSTISQALQFVLQRQTADKQAQLLESQNQVTLEQLTGITLDNQLKEKAKTRADQELLLLGNQLAIGQQQLAIAQQQELNLAADLARTEADTALSIKQLAKIDEDILATRAQVIKINKDSLLVDKQLLVADTQISKNNQEVQNMIAQATKTVADTALAQQSKLNAITQELVLQQQKLKIVGEVSLLTQKVITEKAQTADSINGTTVTGTLGKQRNLYQAQIDGFARNAEQKLAQLYLDSYNVRASLKPDDIDAVSAGVSDPQVASVLEIAKNGVTA